MRYGACEILQVLSETFLISSTWHMHRYAARDRSPLEPGFYLVLWPAPVSSPRYDGNGRYFGPFPTKLLAEQLQTSAVSLGIIDADSCVSAPAAGHCYSQECWQPADGTSGYGGYRPTIRIFTHLWIAQDRVKPMGA